MVWRETVCRYFDYARPLWRLCLRSLLFVSAGCVCVMCAWSMKRTHTTNNKACFLLNSKPKHLVWRIPDEWHTHTHTHTHIHICMYSCVHHHAACAYKKETDHAIALVRKLVQLQQALNHLCMKLHSSFNQHSAMYASYTYLYQVALNLYQVALKPLKFQPTFCNACCISYQVALTIIQSKLMRRQTLRAPQTAHSKSARKICIHTWTHLCT